MSGFMILLLSCLVWAGGMLAGLVLGRLGEAKRNRDKVTGLEAEVAKAKRENDRLKEKPMTGPEARMAVASEWRKATVSQSVGKGHSMDLIKTWLDYADEQERLATKPVVPGTDNAQA